MEWVAKVREVGHEYKDQKQGCAGFLMAEMEQNQHFEHLDY